MSTPPTSGGASARVPASVAHLFPFKSGISAVVFDLPITPTCRRLWARVSRQEGIDSYGSPDGGDAVFSGVGVRGEERLIEAADGS